MSQNWDWRFSLSFEKLARTKIEASVEGQEATT
jgi:hypothetical protein